MTPGRRRASRWPSGTRRERARPTPCARAAWGPWSSPTTARTPTASGRARGRAARCPGAPSRAAAARPTAARARRCAATHRGDRPPPGPRGTAGSSPPRALGASHWARPRKAAAVRRLCGQRQRVCWRSVWNWRERPRSRSSCTSAGPPPRPALHRAERCELYSAAWPEWQQRRPRRRAPPVPLPTYAVAESVRPLVRRRKRRRPQHRATARGGQMAQSAAPFLYAASSSTASMWYEYSSHGMNQGSVFATWYILSSDARRHLLQGGGVQLTLVGRKHVAGAGRTAARDVRAPPPRAQKKDT